ncbi:UNVERIFIED_ORG: hypothetical protein B2H93_14500 [Clostridium botulinum]
MNKQQFLDLGLNEEQATKAEAESKKELATYVAKTSFDEVNNSKKELEKTVKERDTQLEEVKGKVGDNAALKTQIETLQADNKAAKEKYEADVKELKISNAIKLAISDKAQDADLVANLFDKTKLILGEDGKITGLDEQLKDLQTNKAFLFKPIEENKNNPTPTSGFKIGNPNPNPTPEPGQRPSMKDAITARLQMQQQ